MSLVDSDTPMMQQFNTLKQAYPDCILFFRAGDFYEMFGQDAVLASEALNITLTTRNKSSANPVPMAGVPYHARDQYLGRLTAAGFKVAIAEQVEDPALAKGVVKREVVRVLTPGTATAESQLEGDRSHYLMALELRVRTGVIGLAMADLSTGHFEVLEFSSAERARCFEFLRVEHPRELLLPEPRSEKEERELAALEVELQRRLQGQGGDLPPTRLGRVNGAWYDLTRARRRLNEQFGTANLEGFGVGQMETALRAAGALLTYLQDTQKSELAHLAPPRPRRPGGHMWLDEATLSHLEVLDNPAPGGRKHTLFAVLNHTRTSMGARMLRRWLAEPLLERSAVEARLAAVAELVAPRTGRGVGRGPDRGAGADQGAGSGTGSEALREAVRETLALVRDLERIVGRVSLPSIAMADLVALREALGAVQFIPPLLAEFASPLLAEVAEGFDPLEDVYHYLRTHFMEEPHHKLAEGGYIAAGVIPELDSLRELSRNSRQIISALEAREREATGIGSLKIRFNKVFGYYLEISRSQQAKVPAHYVRKQTLVNAERYSLAELEEIEEKILGAEERIGALEYEQFQEARTILKGYARRMQETAARCATLDVLGSYAEAALRHGYVQPEFVAADAPRRLSIVGGRHPVIERIDFDEPFIPNDLALTAEATQIALITGPNMAGKSTVMRQVALIQLMAQAGSFVPAQSATLPLVDRIFTRVGASDNLARGQSTFMMEMNEAANILNNATPESLLILDEIGRGTSTYDGISIAWAMVEHIHRLGALTLFATHYHELTELARELPRLSNFNLSIQEDGERLVFTRKLIAGSADQSYGIHVARLAGLPESVVLRAHDVMASLVRGSDGLVLEAPTSGETARATARATAVQASQANPSKVARSRQQLSLLADAHPMIERLRALDVDNLTPREALDFLFDAKEALDQGEP